MARVAHRQAKDSGQLSFAAAPRPRGPELLVLPDAARVEEHLLRAAASGGFVSARSICTVAELERWLIEAARGPLRIASAAGLSLVYRKIAREQTRRGSPWFAVRETAGFSSALSMLGAALGQGMLAPKELLTLLPQLDETAQRRLGPLAQLLEAARGELEGSGLCDGPSALAFAIAPIRSGPLPARLRGISAIRFEAVLDWPPLRLELLFALAERLGKEGAAVRLVLPFWPERRGLAEEPLAPVLRAIEARGANSTGAVPELILEPIGDEGTLGRFRARLFSTATRSEEQAHGADEPRDAGEAREAGEPIDVSLASCASPSAEAREAARRCADLLDRGAAPDSIAVAVRTLSSGSAEELGFAFDQLGIPWRERRGRPALASAPVKLALSLYELLAQDFPREPLLALLSSQKLWMRAEGEMVSPETISRRLRQARVRDDRSDGGIAAQLDRMSARLRHEREQTEGASRARLERELLEVAEVRARCLRAVAELQSLPSRGTLRAHGDALLKLLERWGLRSRAGRALEDDRREELDRREGPEPTAHGAAANNQLSKATISPLARSAAAAQLRELAAIDALESACDSLAAGARETGQANAVFSRADWSELLASTLAESSLRPAGARGVAVQLVELRELPGRSFSHLIVAGLVDGQLPARGAIDPLLSDEEKRSINRAARRAIFRAPSRSAQSCSTGSGSEFLSLPARQAEEPLLFQLALAAARDSLLLLWPRADARGRETPRSTFADEAARALGLAPSDGEPRSTPAPGLIARIPLAAIPELEACRGAEEFLARAALDAVADPAFRALAPAPAAEAEALLAGLLASPLRDALFISTRAALAERERLGAFIGSRAPGRFSGQLSGAALGAVGPLFLFGPDAPLSASQLENDARCPFRTFGHRVLRLDEEPGSEDDLTARERGLLLHQCLEIFYRRLREQDRLPLAGPRQAWVSELREIALAEMERFAQGHDVGHRALWKIRQRELLVMLEEVVLAETESNALPLALEQSFGGARPEAWAALRIPSPAGDEAVFARGAIDRVDEAAPQTKTAGGGRLVIDYKSGRKEPLARKLRPDALFAPEFQLAIYAAAVRAREPGQPVDAAYLSLRDAQRSQTLRAALGKAGRSIDALLEFDPDRRAQFREQGKAKPESAQPNLADAVWERVSRLRLGLLPVDSLDCEGCDLKPVCRIAALPVDEEAL